MKIVSFVVTLIVLTSLWTPLTSYACSPPAQRLNEPPPVQVEETSIFLTIEPFSTREVIVTNMDEYILYYQSNRFSTCDPTKHYVRQDFQYLVYAGYVALFLIVIILNRGVYLLLKRFFFKK